MSLRRGATTIQGWRNQLDKPVPVRRHPPDVIARIDRRSKKGRTLWQLYRDLNDYVKETANRPPNILEREHINQAVHIKHTLIDLEDKEMNGELTERERQFQLIPARNSFRHELTALGFGEELDLQRQRAEATMVRAYSR